MLKIENSTVFGFDTAIRGMRNPKNSWEKSDSYWTHIENTDTLNEAGFEYFIGENDLKLMHTLAKAGHDHGKFLRMVHVSVDITAPLYWWKEADQYKVGTTTDSCSTMHKIHAKEFTLDDFSTEHLLDEVNIDVNVPGTDFTETSSLEIFNIIIEALNRSRDMFNLSGDKVYWWQMIQLLPTSYNQKRTWDLNYEVLRNIYFARKHHKLDEWHTLCDWIETLPYFKEICIDD